MRAGVRMQCTEPSRGRTSGHSNPDGLKHLRVFAGRMTAQAPPSRQRSRDAVGGGLGDILYQMCHDGGYDALQTLTPQDSV